MSHVTGLPGTDVNTRTRRIIATAAAGHKKKRKGIAISTPVTQSIDEEKRNKEKIQNVLSRQFVRPSERFFASLFLNPIEELANSNKFEPIRQKVLAGICSRLNLPLPPAKLPRWYCDAVHYCTSLASLVIEEARCVLSDALLKQKNRMNQRFNANSKNNNNSSAIQAKLVSTVQKRMGHVVLTFEKIGSAFTTKEVFDVKPGVCFLVVPPSHDCTNILTQHNNNSKRTLSDHHERQHDNDFFASSFLASVFPARKELRDGRIVSLMVYQTYTTHHANGRFTLIPLTSLVSQVRQFEACTSYNNSHYANSDVLYLPKLWAAQENVTPIPFNPHPMRRRKAIASLLKKYKLPALNPTQAMAATSFMDSPPGSLALVQGPPGTGKTTFLVSTITQCLLLGRKQKTKRRILVCAPTNKAITVLASRFLQALHGDTSFNLAMIGVEDKLVGMNSPNNNKNRNSNNKDDPFLISGLSLSLRRIFVYTWMQSIVDDFRSLRNRIHSHKMTKDLHQTAKQLRQKLINTLPYISQKNGWTEKVDKVRDVMGEAVSLSKTNKSQATVNILTMAVVDSLDTLVLALSKNNCVDPIDSTAEILDTADVIFCTLSTAGVSAMKQTKKVNDLFVDEAAAALEPELLIPFHLSPSRMLAVGDPQQLPAIIMSRHATEAGLAKSLMERLMLDCGQNHIMLDVQYRMRPEISLFPSNHFYNTKVQNGSNVMKSDYQVEPCLLNRRPYSFLQIEGCEQRIDGASFSNQKEAVAVVQIVESLRQASFASTGTVEKGQLDHNHWYSPDKIRIITFYQGQVTLLRRLLNQHGLGQVMVATVDSSQGCEADLVIVSFVRSSLSKGNKHNNARQTTGFLTDDRRMNVSLTRAKYQLICVGNARGTLRQSGVASTLEAIVDDAEERKCLLEFSDVEPSLSLAALSTSFQGDTPSNKLETKKRQAPSNCIHTEEDNCSQKWIAEVAGDAPKKKKPISVEESEIEIIDILIDDPPVKSSAEKETTNENEIEIIEMPSKEIEVIEIE